MKVLMIILAVLVSEKSHAMFCSLRVGEPNGVQRQILGTLTINEGEPKDTISFALERGSVLSPRGDDMWVYLSEFDELVKTGVLTKESATFKAGGDKFIVTFESASENPYYNSPTYMVTLSYKPAGSESVALSQRTLLDTAPLIPEDHVFGIRSLSLAFNDKEVFSIKCK